MREHKDTDYVVSFETGEVIVEKGDGSAISDDEHRIDGGAAHLRIPIEDVEGLVAAASAYGRMASDLRHVDVMKGPQIEENGRLVRVGNLPMFKFASGPFFENYEDVLVDGVPAIVLDDCNWTDVTVWDYGNGITFRTPDTCPVTLCVGASLPDLENHLEMVASRSPSP